MDNGSDIDLCSMHYVFQRITLVCLHAGDLSRSWGQSLSNVITSFFSSFVSSYMPLFTAHMSVWVQRNTWTTVWYSQHLIFALSDSKSQQTGHSYTELGLFSASWNQSDTFSW